MITRQWQRPAAAAAVDLQWACACRTGVVCTAVVNTVLTFQHRGSGGGHRAPESDANDRAAYTNATDPPERCTSRCMYRSTICCYYCTGEKKTNVNFRKNFEPEIRSSFKVSKPRKRVGGKMYFRAIKKNRKRFNKNLRLGRRSITF